MGHVISIGNLNFLSMLSFNKAPITILLISLILFLHSKSAAQKYPDQKKFYVGMEMGSGWLKFSQNNNPADYTARFALGFYGGYQPVQWLRVGFNVSGWLIEPFGNFYDDPVKGISISNDNIQLVLLPFKERRLLISLQGGRVVYTNHHPGNYNATGTGIKAGLGYEIKIKDHLVLPISINYGKGKFKDVRYLGISYINQNYDVVELLMGITYR